MTTGSAASLELLSYAGKLTDELEDAAAEPLAAGKAHAAVESRHERFLDREVSWLDFNARVLELAADESVPLLERVRFLAIFANNLDEFFMVRVAGLRRRLANGIATTTAGGLTPQEQLRAVVRRSHELVARQFQLFDEDIRHRLRDEGMVIARWHELDPTAQRTLQQLFAERVYPVLTPLAVDPAHPFPYISGLALNLAIVVHDPLTKQEHFARVKVPALLPRFVPLGDDRYVPIEDVIAAHLPALFPGLVVRETYVFRVTRNEEVDVDDGAVDNLLDALEQELHRRKYAPPVRLEVEGTISRHVLELLVRELGVTPEDVVRVPSLVDLGGLLPLADAGRPELRWPTFVPATPDGMSRDDGSAADVFTSLRVQDVLVHHPYDSFATTVEAFVEQAAADPAVLAIKLTLYRTSGNSPIVDALIDAAEAGKQVLVVVELKARFDEKANVRWARKLEEAGCHVIYGMVGLKTHCKLCLVVRRDPDGSLHRYAHVGTGNYNPRTARIYEDVGLLTADPLLGDELAQLFNHLSGYTHHPDYETLIVAPGTMRRRLLGLVEREMRHAHEGRPAHVVVKVNHLVDEEVVDALYAASGAGVRIDLVVRGMCVLRPGIPGLSRNIRVRSILGRFLEHSRVLRFANGGDEQVWIGSADLMHRNLNRRVEAMVLVRSRTAKDRLSAMLDRAISDDVSAWILGGDGVWTRRASTLGGEALLDYQQQFVRADAALPAPRSS